MSNFFESLRGAASGFTSIATTYARDVVKEIMDDDEDNEENSEESQNKTQPETTSIFSSHGDSEDIFASFNSSKDREIKTTESQSLASIQLKAEDSKNNKDNRHL